MALRAIKDFPKATPSTEDLILIEQQGGGRSVSLKELPVSTPVEKKISDVQKDLNARITALAFEPGDTTGDAELRDIRNPADGFTVPAETNAGGAVRAQVTQLDEKISNLKGDIDDFAYKKITPIFSEDGKYWSISSGIAKKYDITGQKCCSYNISDLIGQKIAISSSLDNTYKVLFIIADINNNVLYSQIDGSNIADVIVPNESVYLYVNGNSNATISVLERHTSMYDIDDTISELEEKFIRRIDILSNATRYNNIYCSGNIGGAVKTQSVTGIVTAVIPISDYAGKSIEIKITNTDTEHPRSFIITNQNNKVEYAQDGYVNRVIIVSDSANNLYVNIFDSEKTEINIIEELSFDSVKNEIMRNDGVNNLIIGKRCVCFGDSITWYDGQTYNWGKEQGKTAKGYESYLREAGMTVTNNGYSGATIRHIVTEKILTTDYSQYDYVTITSGANDSRYQIPTGELADVGSEFDTNTFIGCLQKGIEYILNSNPEIKILLITPIRGWIYTPNGYNVSVPPANDGVVEKRYADAIKEVAELYSLPVCDWYSDCGLNELTRDWYINDPEPDKTAETNPNDLYSLHPSTKGYKRMADLLLSKIRSI